MSINKEQISRRAVIQALLPFGWVSDAIQKKSFTTASRLSLLKDIAIFAPGFLGACSSKPSNSQLKTETSILALAGKLRLINELDTLPISVVEQLLSTRVRPIFEPKPASIKYDGLEVKIWDSSVVLEKTKEPNIESAFNLRLFSDHLPESLFPKKSETRQIPYIDSIFTDSERNSLSTSRAKDGTIMLDINFPADKPFYEGFSPEITIITPSNPESIRQADQKTFRNYERFSFIKEACRALLIDILTEETIKKMHNLGLDLKMEVNASNTTRQAEIVSESVYKIVYLQSRVTSLTNFASDLLAVKALQGTEFDDPKNMAPDLLQLRPSMQAVNLGSSAKEVLDNSFRWVLNTYLDINTPSNRLLNKANNV